MNIMSNDMPRVTINMSEDDDKRLTKLADREKRSFISINIQNLKNCDTKPPT